MANALYKDQHIYTCYVTSSFQVKYKAICVYINIRVCKDHWFMYVHAHASKLVIIVPYRKSDNMYIHTLNTFHPIEVVLRCLCFDSTYIRRSDIQANVSSVQYYAYITIIL